LLLFKDNNKQFVFVSIQKTELVNKDTQLESAYVQKKLEATD